MNFHYQRYLLVLGTFGVAGAIFVAFYSQLANQERNTTLPLGLTLSERSGQLFVDDAMPAAREYGLQRGDAILFVDELGVSTKDRFREAIANKGTGDLISIGIVRNGETITINKRFHGLIETPVAQRQPARPAMEPSRFVQTTQDAPNQETAAPDTVPLSSQDIVSSETFGLHLHEQEGKLVVAKVVPNAAGAAYGVQVNDVLFQVDQTTINSQDDFRQVAGDKSVATRQT